MPPSPTSWKTFERAVAKKLSLWITDGLSDRVLARQSLMGRMAEAEWGDFAPHPECPERWKPDVNVFLTTFFADAKKRRAFSVEKALASPSDAFWGWWKKAADDATAHGKVPLLILAAPRHPEWVAVPTASLPSTFIAPLVVARGYGVSFFLFEEFLKSHNPKRWLDVE